MEQPWQPAPNTEHDDCEQHYDSDDTDWARRLALSPLAKRCSLSCDVVAPPISP
jgi:hypothetical protein